MRSRSNLAAKRRATHRTIYPTGVRTSVTTRRHAPAHARHLILVQGKRRRVSKTPID